MKLVPRTLCALIVLTLASGAFFSALAQTPSATPEPFLSQITSGTAGFNSFAKDVTANGRFVVVESNGDHGGRPTIEALGTELAVDEICHKSSIV